MTLRAAIMALALISLFGSSAGAQKKIALVVGNAAYLHTAPLLNPLNDARDMAAQLAGLGFKVILGTDLDKLTFDLKIKEFAEVLEHTDVGLFFYAGHGLQAKGGNYLVPTDAKLNAERDLDFEAVKLDFILSQMEREAKTNIIFLDACRNNPLARNLARTMGTRGVDENNGLAPVRSGLGTFIAFATQPGAVAADGAGRNSPFSAALKKRLASSGVSLSDIMIDVRNEVVQETKGAQVPWDHSALRGRIYLKGQQPENLILPPPQRTVPLWLRGSWQGEVRGLNDRNLGDIRTLWVVEIRSDGTGFGVWATRPDGVGSPDASMKLVGDELVVTTIYKSKITLRQSKNAGLLEGTFRTASGRSLKISLKRRPDLDLVARTPRAP